MSKKGVKFLLSKHNGVKPHLEVALGNIHEWCPMSESKCISKKSCLMPCLKWRILSRPGKIGTGRNTKYFFSYCAWSTPWGHVLSLKTICQIPALIWAISYSVFQPVKFASTLQKLLATFFQILDIWWSSLDIMDDFKLISRTAIFRFGEINKSWFWVYSKKCFFLFFFSSLLHFEL